MLLNRLVRIAVTRRSCCVPRRFRTTLADGRKIPGAMENAASKGSGADGPPERSAHRGNPVRAAADATGEQVQQRGKKAAGRFVLRL